MAVLVPVFTDLSSLGGQMTCRTICEMKLDPAAYNIIGKAANGVLDDWHEAMNCPNCATMLKDMDNIESGDVIYVSINADGEDIFNQEPSLETWWFDETDDGEDEEPCHIRVNWEDADEPGFGDKIWDGIKLFSSPLSWEYERLASLLEAAGVVDDPPYITSTMARVMSGEDGSMGEFKDTDDLTGVIDLMDRSVNETLETMEVRRSAVLKKPCEEFEEEGKCKAGVTETIDDEEVTLNCFWVDIDGEECRHLPEGGFDDIHVDEDTFREHAEKVTGMDYEDMDVEDFEAENIENFVEVQNSIIKDEIEEITEDELSFFEEMTRDITQQQRALDTQTLRAEEGECLGSFMFKEEDPEDRCERNACPDDLEDWQCAIYTERFNMSKWINNKCDDGKDSGVDEYDICGLALPSSDTKDLEEQGHHEELHPEEAYRWMPRGDLICEPGEGWHMCNANEYEEVTKVIELGEEDIDVNLTCSGHEWQMTEELPEDGSGPSENHSG
ncbi:MAG: hypothetical protein ACLFTQ_00750 [Candidatus Aenigmatarchaeota archaeon]